MFQSISFFVVLILFTNLISSQPLALPFSKAIVQNGLVFPGQVGGDPTHKVYSTYSRNHFPARAFLAVTSLSANAGTESAAVAVEQKSPKQIVAGFLSEVRSGQHPERVKVYMADSVLAHQITSENPITVLRTPANYEAHVNEFLALFGKFELNITELLADGNKVYARWIQKGHHVADIDSYKATGLPLIEFSSAVYRVENGKILEYWLQNDRLGMDEQLKKNALISSGKTGT